LLLNNFPRESNPATLIKENEMRNSRSSRERRVGTRRDEEGRFMSGRGGRSHSGRDSDNYENRYESRARDGYSTRDSVYDNDDNYGSRYGRSSHESGYEGDNYDRRMGRSGSRAGVERDEEGRFMGHRGGRLSRDSDYDNDDYYESRYARSSYEPESEDEDYGERFGRGGSRGHGGWFGDSAGHSKAARQGRNGR
jgi:hypothetical protein